MCVMFPIKLFKLLEQSSVSEHACIVSWLPHGRAFKIHDEKMFEKHVLKAHFQSSSESFKRQLYFYGFKKIGKRFIDFGAYYHSHFIRDQPKLCCKIFKLHKSLESDFQVPNFDKVPRYLQNARKCSIVGKKSV